LIWQVGTGYYGCRMPDGGFDAERFAQTAANDCVKAIELKLSQGAKPGHGGILPAAKITKEIAAARGIPMGEDCLSPSYHRTFTTPIGLIEFVAQLRELARGKPVGIKLAVGDPHEWLGVCHAMVETGIAPDFVTVDGGEGGTGAAPIEFADRIGMPLTEALVLVHQSLVGAGLRDGLRLIASGKLVTGFEMASACALGADGIDSARGFMLALGCIQAQKCHTNSCPVGVATQDEGLARSLVVPDKAARVHQFHCQTVHAFAEVIGAAGLDHPSQLRPDHLYRRVSPSEIRPLSALYPRLEPGALLRTGGHGFIRDYWDESRADTFNRH
jgi:glutamate synthase domain-containing protein 2